MAQSIGPATPCPRGSLGCCQTSAFDRVDHRLLLQSFCSLGVRGISLQWLQSCLSNRSIQVCVVDNLSSTASITSEVPQGSVLGPLLFLVHFRRIPEAMSPSQTSLALFADDTMAFQENCSGKRQTSPCCDLGKHLGSLSCWAASNNVDFNAAKSTDLVGCKPPPSVSLCGSLKVLEKVQLKVARPLLTHNVGNQDRRCSLSATFRRSRGGEESIVFVSYTNCTMAKSHRR